MRVEACRSCGAPIVWAKTAGGKWMPMETNGTPDGRWAIEHRSDGGDYIVERPADATEGMRSHYATCPQAAQWRKK